MIVITPSTTLAHSTKIKCIRLSKNFKKQRGKLKMNYEIINNKAVLCGEIIKELEFSHEMFGEKFYEFELKVARLSDSFDVIPITVSERLIEDQHLAVGETIKISGQFRSYNKLENEKSKLMLTMFIREFLDMDYDNQSVNQIEIIGYVCKEPIYRTTPFNREICDMLLAVNRNYGKSDYIPCIAWGRNARFAKDFVIGEKLKVVGRIQSREYQKKYDEEVVTKVAYEVSLSRISRTNEEEDMQQNTVAN